MSRPIHRRQLLGLAGATAVGVAWSPNWTAVQETFAAQETLLAGSARAADSPQDAFQYCLNTSSIRAAKLPITEVISLAADAGYDGIEFWIRDISEFGRSGRDLRELKKRLEDTGLEAVNAIGFAQWIVDDDERRANGMEEMKRDMDLCRQIGARRIAAPPAGAREPIDLFRVADRYAVLLELGAAMGVTPQLELWGSSRTLSRLGQLAFVAAECGREDAKILPDVFHIFRGGSDFAGLRCMHGPLIEVFHMNDYPDRPREELSDADRVFPGDGVAPLGEIVRAIQATGFRGMLSLELFNREYWKQDPRLVADTGLKKMKATVRHAFS